MNYQSHYPTVVFAIENGSITANVPTYPNIFEDRPRKPKQRRELPVFTSGLETRLMKCIGEDTEKLIRYLTNKIGEPNITNGLEDDVYRFTEQLTTRKVLPFVPVTVFDQSNIFDPNHIPAIKQKTITIRVTLHICSDRTLTHFNFQVSGYR